MNDIIINTTNEVTTLSVLNVEGPSRWGLLTGTLSAQKDLYSTLSSLRFDINDFHGSSYTLSQFNELSAKADNTDAFVVTNSDQWTTAYTTSTAYQNVSGNWQTAYNWVTSNSAIASFTTSVSARYFYGDGSNLQNLPSSGGGSTAGALLSTLNGSFNALNANIVSNTLSATALSGTHYGNGSKLSNIVVNGGGVANIQTITQANYNIITPDPNTLYIII
jgi:hypothetical protein